MTIKITEDMIRAAARSFRGYLAIDRDKIGHVSTDFPADEPGTPVNVEGTFDLELPMLRALLTVIPDAEIVPTGRWLKLGETMVKAADTDPKTTTSDRLSPAPAARKQGWLVGTDLTPNEGNYPSTTITDDRLSAARAARERGWKVGTRFTTNQGNYPFTVTAIGRRAVAAMGTSGPFIGVEGLVDYHAVIDAREVTDADQ